MSAHNHDEEFIKKTIKKPSQTVGEKMAKKIQITEKQALQFNKMLATLKRISKDYQTLKQLRRGSEGQYGLAYEEALEMAYENIQGEASTAYKGLKFIVIA